MSATYRLSTIADLLTVPPDRLDACLRDLQYALELVHFVNGSGPIKTRVDHWDWTNDGDHSARIDDQDGKPFLSLEVTPKEPA